MSKLIRNGELLKSLLKSRYAFPIGFAVLAVSVLGAGLLMSNLLQPGRNLMDWSTARHLPQPIVLPDFSLVDQNQQKFSRQDLHGKFWVADFIFLQCNSTCPTLSANIADLQSRLDSNVKFVSFSLAPTDDSAALKQYQNDYRRNDPNRWQLLAADQKDLPHLLTVLSLANSETDAKEGLVPINPYYFLIDPQGRVIGAYNGTVKDQLDMLVADVSGMKAATP